ncbi:hypothetical protein ACFLVC_04540 [Chloroflexota bacterium]
MAEEDNNTRKPENQDKDIKPSPSSSIDTDQIKHIGGYLEELEETREKLKTMEIGVEEAKQRLRDISEIYANINVEQEAKETKQVTEVEETIEAEAKEEFEEANNYQRIEDAEFIEGELNLILVSPVDLGRIRELKKHLYQVQDLRLVLQSGSVDTNTTIIVSAEKPIPLINILSTMPPINQVCKAGNQIQVILKGEY